MQNLVVITRPQPEAQDYARELEAEGFLTVCAPMLKTQAQSFTPPNLDDYQGLLFTSAQGVQFFASAMMAADMPVYCSDVPVYCVGKHTAMAAKNQGFQLVVDVDGTGQDLAAHIGALDGAQDVRFLHVRGREVAYRICDDLKARGIEADDVIVYATDFVRDFPEGFLQHLKAGHIDLVTFFSKRTAEAFFEAVDASGIDREAFSGIKSLSISTPVLECVRIFSWAQAYVSETPNRAGMLDVLKEIYGRD